MTKKLLVFSIAVPLTIIALSGCGNKSTPVDGITGENPITATDYQKAAEDLAKIQNPGNPAADAEQAMQDLAQLGSKYELADFEKSESLDLPADFPKAFVYSGAKITSASDSSSDENIDVNITQKTKDAYKDVSAYFKKLVTDEGWKITSQSSEGSSYDIYASKGNESLTLYVSTQQYSALTEIYISYTTGNY